MGSAVLLLAAVLAQPSTRAPHREVTLDWIFSDDGEDLPKPADARWTADGNVLFLDGRGPKAARTLERFQLASGARSKVDAGAALASLAPLLDPKDRPEELEWPVSFDGAGQQAAYAYAGDLFRLDLKTSRFDALTRTGAEELQPHLSPDGTKLAFVRDNDLWLMDLDDKHETRLTADGSATILNGRLSWLYWEEVFNHGDAGIWWSEDSSAIAFLRTDESPVSVASIVDFAPVVPRVLQQRYPKAGGDNPMARLGIADLRTGKTAWLDASSVAYEYLVQVKWLAGSAALGVETLNRGQDRTDLYLVDRTTAAARHVLTATDPAWVNLIDFHFLADGKSLIATSEDDGHTHLYRFGLDGQKQNAVTQGPWSVRGATNWEFSPLAASVDEARGVAYFTAREKSLVERQLYRVGLDGTGLERLSREAGAHKVVFSPNHRHYLDWHSSHDTPPSLSLHDADGTTRSVLVPALTERLASFAMRYAEFLSIPAADGQPLQARLYKPNGFDPGRRYPLIVYVYGEPNAPAVVDGWEQWPAGNVLYDQVLLQNGYLVACVDPRSSTAATKALENVVLKRVSGEVETSDIVAAVRWLKAQAFVDPARVGIWGWSGGGTTTLMAVTRSTEFKAAIAVAPVTDRRYYDTKYVEAYMKTPEQNPEGYDEVSLVKRAKDLHGRLLLVYGSGDDNVHPQNSLAFADELIAAAKPFEMMVYPMRKHEIEDRAAHRHLYEKMLDFWKRSL
jgi:dipeptidyl-peptidase-4